MKKMICALGLLLSSTVFAAPIKVGVLAPEGTGWAKNIKKMVTEIKEATKGEVDIKIYYGGSQGDEQDVLRKIRIGQLHGGIFTGKTLGEINGDVRLLEIPFTFNHDKKQALAALNEMNDFFNQKFLANKFVNLATFEIGHVYLFTQKKVEDLAGMKTVKIWLWDGDPVVTTLFETMKLIGVPLALPDVLSSLSTGVIEAAYAPPLGAIALQWNTKVKYMVDFPISYSIGAFVLSTKSWEKVSAANKAITLEISRKFQNQINAGNSKDNDDAITAMKMQNIEFVKFKESDLKEAQGLREVMIQKLTGKLFSKEAVLKLNNFLKK